MNLLQTICASLWRPGAGAIWGTSSFSLGSGYRRGARRARAAWRSRCGASTSLCAWMARHASGTLLLLGLNDFRREPDRWSESHSEFIHLTDWIQRIAPLFFFATRATDSKHDKPPDASLSLGGLNQSVGCKPRGKSPFLRRTAPDRQLKGDPGQSRRVRGHFDPPYFARSLIPRTSFRVLGPYFDNRHTTYLSTYTVAYMRRGKVGGIHAHDVRTRGRMRTFAALICQTVVGVDDPALAHPSKFVGQVYAERQAEQLADERGWEVRRDGTSWRRVVPSPRPKELVEFSPSPIC